jgi:hypothetical protein
MVNNPRSIELTGQLNFPTNYLLTQAPIDRLINYYLSYDNLHDRLHDLPLQWQNPQPRPWKAIDWHTINQNQVIGIKPEVFVAIVVGATNTEAPIRGYTQTSRQYLQLIHPQMARFVGGIADKNGRLLELGLWEKEERQHTPALNKIHQQLTGKKLTLSPPTAKNYQPSTNPYQDLYRHGLHRVMTEYGAVCLYLWLMSHTTGTLRQVFSELLQDEINHMTKFWGFGVWLFPQSSCHKICRILGRVIKFSKPTNLAAPPTSSLINTFSHMMEVLNWKSWPAIDKLELIYTFVRVMYRLRRWHKSLTPEYLQLLFGLPPKFS